MIVTNCVVLLCQTLFNIFTNLHKHIPVSLECYSNSVKKETKAESLNDLLRVTPYLNGRAGIKPRVCALGHCLDGVGLGYQLQNRKLGTICI